MSASNNVSVESSTPKIIITVKMSESDELKTFSGSLKDARKVWDEAFEFMASAEAAFETDNDLPDEELPLR